MNNNYEEDLKYSKILLERYLNNNLSEDYKVKIQEAIDYIDRNIK